MPSAQIPSLQSAIPPARPVACHRENELTEDRYEEVPEAQRSQARPACAHLHGSATPAPRLLPSKALMPGPAGDLDHLLSVVWGLSHIEASVNPWVKIAVKKEEIFCPAPI